MNGRITNLSGIELGVGPRGEYYLFVTSETLQESTMIPLQASDPAHSHRKVLDAWIDEQLKNQKAK
jgi:hypothetical protein